MKKGKKLQQKNSHQSGIDRFFVRTDMPLASQDVARVKEPSKSLEDYVIRKRGPLIAMDVPTRRVNPRKSSHIERYEVSGKMPPKLRFDLLQRSLACYSQVHNISISEQYPSSGYVSAVEFDPNGEHLASASFSGMLSILKITGNISGVSRYSEKQLKLCKYVHPRLEGIHWSPSGSNEVACVADGTNSIFCIDVNSSNDGNSQVLSVKTDGRNFGQQDNRKMGLSDFCFFSGSPHRLAACSKAGNIYIWDRRKANQQACSTLTAAPALGPLHCIQLGGDDQVVFAGTDSGCIQAWDLRGGRQTAAFCGASEVYYPPLLTLSVAQLFAASSLLQKQQIKPSAVHSLSFDSSNLQRLAFHLNNGWSGVLDLGSLALSHGHCPPPPWSLLEGSEPPAWQPWTRIRRRRPAWLGLSSVFCAPASGCNIVNLLNFGSGLASRNSLHALTSTRDERNGGQGIEVAVSEPPVSVATQTLGDDIAIGTLDGSILLITQGAQPRPLSGDS